MYQSNLRIFTRSSCSVSNVLIAIDAGVSDYQLLADGVIANAEVVILNKERNGVEQITEVLAQHPEIDTVHVVSHGAPGCLYLGNTQLNLENLPDYDDRLKTWFSSKTPLIKVGLFHSREKSGKLK
jgi:hypothetical protein